MISDKEIEEVAASYGKKLTGGYYPHELINICNDFTAGAKWMREKIMSEASKADSEIFNKFCSEWHERFRDYQYDEEFVGHTAAAFFRKGYSSAKLSSVKEIEQLKQRLEIAEKELQAWEKYAKDEGIIISAEKEQ